jgi:hypothetical protein
VIALTTQSMSAMAILTVIARFERTSLSLEGLRSYLCYGERPAHAGNHSGFEVLSRDIAVSSLTQYFQGGSANEFS